MTKIIYEYKGHIYDHLQFKNYNNADEWIRLLRNRGCEIIRIETDEVPVMDNKSKAVGS